MKKIEKNMYYYEANVHLGERSVFIHSSLEYKVYSNVRKERLTLFFCCRFN